MNAPIEYQFHSEPFEHQRRVFHESKDLTFFGILWEQGCGKTKLAIDNACYLWEQGKIDGVIVVAPNGVHRNWLTDELPAHVPTRLRSAIAAQYWDNPRAATKTHQKKMEDLLKHEGFAWLFISYDAFMTKRGKEYVWRFLSRRRVFYALDEAHNVKTPGAKRTKSIIASGVYAAYRRIMTGTPVSVGPFDIYSQIRFLLKGFWKRYGLDSFRVFRFHFANYFTAKECQDLHGYDPGFDKLLSYKNIDELADILKSVSSRETKESAGLNLPPKLFSKRYYDMTREQQQLYNELKEQYLIELEDGAIVDGSLAIVRLLRLQQIICGYLKTDQDEPERLIGPKNPRMELLEEITSGFYQPAIIWARFSRDVDQIMDMLGSKAVRYDGKVSDDDCALAKQRFQKGDVQFFVGNPQKGKEGLTLIQAHHMVYYSNSFKLIDRLQSEDRAHRIGLKHPVDYIDLCCPGTVDEHIIRSLRQKHDIAAKLTGDELKEWL